VHRDRGPGAEVDAIAVMQGHLVPDPDLRAVDERAVGRTRVEHGPAAVRRRDQDRVQPADARIGGRPGEVDLRRQAARHGNEDIDGEDGAERADGADSAAGAGGVEGATEPTEVEGIAEAGGRGPADEGVRGLAGAGGGGPAGAEGGPTGTEGGGPAGMKRGPLKLKPQASQN